MSARLVSIAISRHAPEIGSFDSAPRLNRLKNMRDRVIFTATTLVVQVEQSVRRVRARTTELIFDRDIWHDGSS